VLADGEILQLARWAVAIEKHYGRPMDMEWARDGETGELFIVQARPETVHGSVRAGATLRSWRLQASAKPILAGAAVGEAIAAGPVRVVHGPDDIAGFSEGAVLVAEATDPDWVPLNAQGGGHRHRPRRRDQPRISPC
jgi:pyruvate, water dikinase